MAPPVKEEEEVGEEQGRRGGAGAEEEEEAPRDELAEMMAGLGLGEPEGAAAERDAAVPAPVARFWWEDAAVAAADHFFPVPAFPGHRGADPYAYAPPPPPLLPAGGAARGICPVAPARGARGYGGNNRRGHVVGPRNVQGATTHTARSAHAGGMFPGAHAYMPPPPPFLHSLAAVINPLMEDPDLLLPEQEQALLFALSHVEPEAIVSYACGLMESRHGQRLFRLVVENCDHDLREWVVARITRDKKSFWRMCAQRSDEVIYMIKACETRRSMQLLREAMLSWMAPNLMHALMTDSNRLRVVQAFILHCPRDIAQFIFEAVARNCTRLACQSNGLSLLQNCLNRVSQKERDDIFTEIAYRSLHLAQNSCGNYIVQDVLKRGEASHIEIIASCLRNNYVGLSRQKYSSNVVEWCLRVFNDGERFIVVNELISYPYFKDLVTDEYANFVLSTALQTCNFPVQNMLAQAILSQNVNHRNQHCLKIFGILSKHGFMR